MILMVGSLGPSGGISILTWFARFSAKILVVSKAFVEGSELRKLPLIDISITFKVVGDCIGTFVTLAVEPTDVCDEPDATDVTGGTSVLLEAGTDTEGLVGKISPLVDDVKDDEGENNDVGNVGDGPEEFSDEDVIEEKVEKDDDVIVGITELPADDALGVSDVSEGVEGAAERTWSFVVKAGADMVGEVKVIGPEDITDDVKVVDTF